MPLDWILAAISVLSYVGVVVLLVLHAPPSSGLCADFPAERYKAPEPGPSPAPKCQHEDLRDKPVVKDRPRQSLSADLLSPEDISMSVETLTDAVWFERRTDHGEDAAPFAASNAANSGGFLAVADGLGGSGNQRIKEFGGVTGAKLASALVIDSFGEYVLSLVCKVLASSPRRLKARENVAIIEKFILKWSTDECFVNRPKILDGLVTDSRPVPAVLTKDSIWATHMTGMIDAFNVGDLEAVIDRRMNAFSARATPVVSLVKSNMSQKLPTTLAAVIYERIQSKPSTYKTLSIWAGDSRVYAITPSGLRRLTVDRTTNGGVTHTDHLAEGKMDSCISERTPNRLEFSEDTVSGPAFLFVCSDGVYELQRGAKEFEEYLVEVIGLSDSEEDFRQRLLRDFEQFAGDDCSMAFTFLGVGSFSDARAAIGARRAAPFASISSSTRDGAARGI